MFRRFRMDAPVAPAGPSFADKIESGVGVYGKVTGVLGSIAGVFIGIVMILIAIFMVSDNSNKERTVGVVTNVKKCIETSSQGPDKKIVMTELCDFNISYRVKDVEYTMNIRSFKDSYDVGSTVTVYYDPQVPSDADVYGPASKYIAVVLGGLGFIILTFCAIKIYYVVTSDTYAKIHGAKTIVSDTAGYLGLGPYTRNQDGGVDLSNII